MPPLKSHTPRTPRNAKTMDPQSFLRSIGKQQVTRVTESKQRRSGTPTDIPYHQAHRRCWGIHEIIAKEGLPMEPGKEGPFPQRMCRTNLEIQRAATVPGPAQTETGKRAKSYLTITKRRSVEINHIRQAMRGNNSSQPPIPQIAPTSTNQNLRYI